MDAHLLKIGTQMEGFCQSYLSGNIGIQDLKTAIYFLSSALDSTQPKEFSDATFQFVEIDIEDSLCMDSEEDKRKKAVEAVMQFIKVGKLTGVMITLR